MTLTAQQVSPQLDDALCCLRRARPSTTAQKQRLREDFSGCRAGDLRLAVRPTSAGRLS